jgi:hypothetical protein
MNTAPRGTFCSTSRCLAGTASAGAIHAIRGRKVEPKENAQVRLPPARPARPLAALCLEQLSGKNWTRTRASEKQRRLASTAARVATIKAVTAEISAGAVRAIS